MVKEKVFILRGELRLRRRLSKSQARELLKEDIRKRDERTQRIRETRKRGEPTADLERSRKVISNDIRNTRGRIKRWK